MRENRLNSKMTKNYCLIDGLDFIPIKNSEATVNYDNIVTRLATKL